MSTRAFIVAVEQYDPNSRLGRIKGVNQAAAEFIRWLTDVKHVDEILCCARGLAVPASVAVTPTQITFFDCDRTGVKEALRELKARVAQGPTEQLFCYLAGHGFRYKDRTGSSDYLALFGMIEPENDGDECLCLTDIRECFLEGLGYGDQYYFVDMCRSDWDDDVDGPARFSNSLGVAFMPYGNGRANDHLLFPAQPGDSTWASNQFAAHLVNGLSGQGRARSWVGHRMCVLFGSLRNYVFKKTNTLGDFEGKDEDELYEVHPARPCEGVVQIDGVGPNDVTTVTASLAGGLSRSFSIQGAEGPTPPDLMPYDFEFTARTNGIDLERVEPPPGQPVECYEPFVLRFRRVPVPVPPTPPVVPPLGELRLRAPDDTEIEVFDPATHASWRGRSPVTLKLPAGNYQARAFQDGVILEEQPVAVLEHGTTFRFLDRSRQESLRNRLRDALMPDLVRDPRVPMSDMTEWDVGTWLALIGAAHLLGRAQGYQLIDRLRLPPLDEVPAGGSALFFLSAFEHGPDVCHVEWSQKEGARLSSVSEAVEGLPGVSRLVVPFGVSEGPLLLTYRVGERPPMTVVSHALANRATFVTLSESASGAERLHQYLLPMQHLFEALPSAVLSIYRERWHDAPLTKIARTMYLAQRLFARNLPVSVELDRLWDELLMSKWLDPILTLIGAFDIFRYRKAEPGGYEYPPHYLEEMLGNMRRYFGSLPDIEALAMLMKKDWRLPDSPPLLLYATRCFDPDHLGEGLRLPYPASQLDLNSPWTAWKPASREASSEGSLRS